jgi:predicted alpha/beta hydrolase family esterase
MLNCQDEMRFFMIHGAYGSPEENWFPWLRKELMGLGHEVIVPGFPTPEGQTLENWMKVFEEYMDKIDEDTVFIGHSLAPAFILAVLERINVKVKACFFVAGFIEGLGNEFDRVNESFIGREFDWDKIRASSGSFHVYSSDDDPYVPLERGRQLAEKLGVQIKLVEGAGHFNEAAGYVEFRLLLDDIRRLI